VKLKGQHLAALFLRGNVANQVKQEVFNFLLQQAQEHGTAIVFDACNMFLKTGLKAEATKRQKIPREWVQAAWIKSKGRCAIGGEVISLDEATGDHVVAISLGGEHSRRNIQVVCRSHNSEKSNKNLTQHSKQKGRLYTEMFENTAGEDRGES